MAKKTCLIGAALCALIFSACVVIKSDLKEGALTFYVSPKGDDSWSGRRSGASWSKQDGPFRTVAKARDAIRALKRDGALKMPVTVFLEEGVYYQNETLIFTPEDSGTAEFPVTYQAVAGRTAVISGGFPLSGWQRDSSEQSRAHCQGKLLKLKLPDNPIGESWNFNQLYVNGGSRVRARSPNKGRFFRSAGATGTNEKREFFFNEGDIKEWRDLRQVLLTVYHSWETSLHHIQSIDMEFGVVTLREPSPWPMGRWEKKQRYYVEGVFEALDQPGEWYLDRSEQTLYYYPLPGEKPASLDVTAPLLTSTLVEFKGEPSEQRYIRHVNFKGITFQHTDAKLRRFRNPGQAEIYQPALIMATGLRNATIENCEISCAAAHAVWLGAGSVENTVRQCHMHSLGGGGVYIGEPAHGKIARPALSNTVDNCYIHNGGTLFHGAHGVWIGASSHNTITHNEISNLDYTGIACGWSWGFKPSTAHHNSINYNHIHHLSNGEGLSDMGGIYTLGRSPQTILRHNIIHDIYNYEHVSHGSGLYPDEGSSYILMENNLVYNVRNSPLFMHYGADCTVHNNILALGDKGQLRRSREDKRCHYNAIGNIIYSSHPRMLDGPWKNKDWHLEKNLYWCASGKPDFAGRDFAAWQAEGNDQGSLVADPLFKNPKKGDFSLKSGSPASKIGFKPIDFSETGLYGDKKWRLLPNKFANREMVKIEAPTTDPISINYTFEELKPGSKPLDADVSVSGSTSVMVAELPQTAQEPASDLEKLGKHCLEFKDSANARHRWQPHLVYKRSYTNANVTLAWEMLNSKEKPASFSLELREYAGGSYLTGPQISVSKSGAVKASGKTITTMPSGVWVNVKIQLVCGGETPGAYKLELSIPGQKSIVKTIPFNNAKFKNTHWLGIMGNSSEDALFHIDNLRMGTAEELANPPRRRVRRTRQATGKAYGKDKLAAHWDFEEDAGFTVLDKSGCGNVGELWAIAVKGTFGNAAYFNNDYNHINMPDSPSLRFGKKNFSISLWISPETLALNLTDKRRRFVSKNKHPETWWNMNLTTGGKVTVELADHSQAHFGCASTRGIPLKKWSHLVLTVNRDNNEVRYYINGELDSTHKLPSTFKGSLDVKGADLTIGSTWNSFNGLIDEIKIHKRPLSAEEIGKEYHQLKSQYNDTKYVIVE